MEHIFVFLNSKPDREYKVFDSTFAFRISDVVVVVPMNSSLLRSRSSQGLDPAFRD